MLSDAFQQLALKVNTFSQDVAAISDSIKNKEELVSRKTLEPTVRLRKNAKEVLEAQSQDPQIQFIKDQLTDIFGE